MENNTNTKHLRKLRKIKKALPGANAPVSFGVPSKINAPVQPKPDDNSDDAYFASKTENLSQSSGDAENIRFVSDEELIPPSQLTFADLMKNKTCLVLILIAAIFGAIISYALFPARHAGVSGRGLDGIVFNPDVPAGRSRCGLVDPHQGCVLYIMNPRNQEIAAKEFYTTASKWTQRERYLIEIGNMHYGSTVIKPGYIAQINIPPLSY